ncbi:MAG: hypothetical protein ABIJ61_07170, partial [bacterium]
YRYWDILKAPRIALSGKNLLAQGRSLLFGYLGYLILTYVALLVDGVNFDYAWTNFGLFPICSLDLYTWYAKAIWVLGVIIFAAFAYLGALVVARLAFEELKGNYFFPLKQACKESRPNLRVFIVALLVLALMIVVLGLLQAVVGLVALIPTVGEIIYAVIYALPIFLWSLFIVFVAFGLSTAFLTLPAIITLSEKESFGASFYVFNVIWTQPLRWFSLTGISFLLAKVGTFVLAYFFMRALQLSNWAVGLFAGDKMNEIIAAGNGMIARHTEALGFLTHISPGCPVGFNWLGSFGYAEPTGSGAVAAFIIYIVLLLLGFVVLSFGINIITAGQVITNLLIRYVEDDEKLTEELQVEEITATDGSDDPVSDPPAAKESD